MWTTMIRTEPAPMACAASVWPNSRILSTWPRSSRAGRAHSTPAISTISTSSPRPKYAARTKTSTKNGSDSVRSTSRMMAASTQPRCHPAIRAAAAPSVVAATAAISPTARETRAPKTSWDHRSRPRSSVPSRCSADGASNGAPLERSGGCTVTASARTAAPTTRISISVPAMNSTRVLRRIGVRLWLRRRRRAAAEPSGTSAALACAAVTSHLPDAPAGRRRDTADRPPDSLRQRSATAAGRPPAAPGSRAPGPR